MTDSLSDVSPQSWSVPPSDLKLGERHLHLWRVDLADGADGPYWDCLSEDELARAQRFRFDRDRTRFIQSRGSLRHILGRYLGQSPADLIFTYGTYGKPSCGAVLSFNLSHSGNTALCAVTRHRRVGIDVEQHREITHFESLSRRCLTAVELQQVQAVPVGERQQLFLQYWTAKEAYLKAVGCGLTQSLTSVSLQLRPPKLLQVPEPGDWYWQPIVVEDGAGAVVVEGATEMMQYGFVLS